MRSQVNFAYTGNPAVGPYAAGLPSAWPAYAAASDQNLRITTPRFFVQSQLRASACAFWDTLGYDRGEELMRAMLKRIK